MGREAHPVVLVDAFVKLAKDATRPYGMSDATRAGGNLGKQQQRYTQPNPPAAATRPDLSQDQKALLPPPVM